MKFNTIALSPLVILAVAATTTTATATATATATTSSTSPEDSCTAKCKTGDTCCAAMCHNVPCPDATQVNDTHSCIAACPKPSPGQDASAYNDCQQGCLSNNFFPGSGGATATASSRIAHASGSSASSNAAGRLKLEASAVVAVGLVMTVFLL